MKAQERQRLKQNEFANSVQAATSWFAANRDLVTKGATAILAIVILVSAYFAWQRHVNEQAGTWLGIAMATAEAPVVPPPTLPGATQTPNTFPTEKARAEAAITAFKEVINRYSSSNAAMVSRVEIGGLLLSQNRFAEAEQAYQAIVTDAPKSFYAPAARLGAAEAQAAQNQYDKAIATLTDLAAQRDGALPVDGILMQLAKTCLKAGKTQDARAAFKRVVDEFPSSPYTSEARQQLTAIG